MFVVKPPFFFADIKIENFADFLISSGRKPFLSKAGQSSVNGTEVFEN